MHYYWRFEHGCFAPDTWECVEGDTPEQWLQREGYSLDRYAALYGDMHSQCFLTVLVGRSDPPGAYPFLVVHRLGPDHLFFIRMRDYPSLVAFLAHTAPAVEAAAAGQARSGQQYRDMMTVLNIVHLSRPFAHEAWG
jgi:hypothetical protein